MAKSFAALVGVLFFTAAGRAEPPVMKRPQQYFQETLFSTTEMMVLALKCESADPSLAQYECDLASNIVHLKKAPAPQPDPPPYTAEQVKKIRKDLAQTCSPAFAEKDRVWREKRRALAFSPEAKAALEDEFKRGSEQLGALCACRQEPTNLGVCVAKAEAAARTQPRPRTCMVSPPFVSHITFVRKDANTWTSQRTGMLADRTNIFYLLYDAAQDSWTYRETNVPSPKCGTNSLEPSCQVNQKAFSSHHSVGFAEKLNCEVVDFGF